MRSSMDAHTRGDVTIRTQHLTPPAPWLGPRSPTHVPSDPAPPTLSLMSCQCVWVGELPIRLPPFHSAYPSPWGRPQRLSIAVGASTAPIRRRGGGRSAYPSPWGHWRCLRSSPSVSTTAAGIHAQVWGWRGKSSFPRGEDQGVGRRVKDRRSALEEPADVQRAAPRASTGNVRVVLFKTNRCAVGCHALRLHLLGGYKYLSTCLLRPDNGCGCGRRRQEFGPFSSGCWSPRR